MRMRSISAKSWPHRRYKYDLAGNLLQENILRKYLEQVLNDLLVLLCGTVLGRFAEPRRERLWTAPAERQRRRRFRAGEDVTQVENFPRVRKPKVISTWPEERRLPLPLGERENVRQWSPLQRASWGRAPKNFLASQKKTGGPISGRLWRKKCEAVTPWPASPPACSSGPASRPR